MAHHSCLILFNLPLLLLMKFRTSKFIYEIHHIAALDWTKSVAVPTFRLKGGVNVSEHAMQIMKKST